MSDFRLLAACRPGTGIDPELFFPVATTGPLYELQVAEAKAVCGRCPVEAQCLEYAMDAITIGVAGGLTEDERRGRSQRRRIVPTPHTEPVPSSASRADRRKAGMTLLTAGHTPAYVADRVGVDVRSVHRWVHELPVAANS